jgi:hypothetical protein
MFPPVGPTAKCSKRRIPVCARMVEAAASAFTGSHGFTSSGKSSMGTVDQRTAGFQRLIFLEMRNDAAPAFKRTYIGQCAETLRPSDQSHVLSAAWTQRQLGPRAFGIYDEAVFSAIHAQLHWLPLLSRTSLAVVEARQHTIQTARKTRTDDALIHYKRVGHRSLPPRCKSVNSAQASRAHCMLRARTPFVSSHGCGQSGKVSKTVNSCVALLRMRRTCS